MSGVWVMVCGPSGAGKDSVMAWAADALAGEPRVCFARRLVTRAAHPGSDHDEVSPAAMRRLHSAGALAWHWQAHGCDYAIRGDYADRVAQGQVVVVNGSREHVRGLQPRPDVRTVLVTAAAGLLATRLASRGRESHLAVAARLQRNAALATPAADRVIINERQLAVAGAALRDYLMELAR